MLYPLAIQAGDRNTAFGVIVPDLPGCFSAGDSYRGLKSNGTKTYAKTIHPVPMCVSVAGVALS